MDMKQPAARPESASTEGAALIPPVDVVEDEGGITLKADLPGVSRDALSVRVDGETLTIEGAVSLGETRLLEAVYAEVRVAQFKRTFAHSRDLDTSKIDAAIKDGVLKVRVPKLEQAKPRRIAVRAE